MNYKYNVKKTILMSDEESKDSAELFSKSYGMYSQNSSRRPGERVHMSPAFFDKKYKKENIYIATCRSRKKLVGQAIYIRKTIEKYGTVTWVLQLVVDEKYRRKGIGSTLLHSIWGFSDDYAWGLATKNPCTVRTLENATFRKCDPSVISKNVDIIKDISNELQFVIDDKYEINSEQSMAFTDFDVADDEFNKGIGDNWALGELKPGYEWIAFTFKEQKTDENLVKKHFEKLIEFSEDKLKEAYGRMKMEKHSWASHQGEEIDYILKVTGLQRGNVLDVGCGNGRHSYELSGRGFEVKGIDFSYRNITKCKNRRKDNSLVTFETKDIRDYKDDKQYNIVLGLYDVIGSFPMENENDRVIEMMASKVAKDGYLVISVMNREFTEYMAKYTGDLSKDNSILYELNPSMTMQSSGDIFNPDYYVVDNNTGLVYRKEQFAEDDDLQREYVVVDRRYRLDEIVEKIKKHNFDIVDSRYVQAGRFETKLEATDSKAKEILIIAKRR